MQQIKPSKHPDPMPELQLLPMFYLFPIDLLVQSEFLYFPRNPHEVRESDYWMSMYNHDKFLETVIDGMAFMLWKHFGIKAVMESFSGYYPFWQLARSGEWIQIARRCGYNTYTLASASRSYQFPIFSYEAAEAIFIRFVKIFRLENPLDEWIDAVQAHPAHEDYEPSRWSRGRIDFYRRWYHSRTKKKTRSVNYTEEWNRLDKDYLTHDPCRMADFSLDYGNFLETLTEKDREILEWLLAGYTRTEIAAAMGYANHSAITKRVQKIGEKYKAFMKQNL